MGRVQREKAHAALFDMADNALYGFVCDVAVASMPKPYQHVRLIEYLFAHALLRVIYLSGFSGYVIPSVKVFGEVTVNALRINVPGFREFLPNDYTNRFFGSFSHK